MDPRMLIRNEQYVFEPHADKKVKVFFVHETINHYVFISNSEMIRLTPSAVNVQISNYAEQME